jgi:hypothetical protein
MEIPVVSVRAMFDRAVFGVAQVSLLVTGDF